MSADPALADATRLVTRTWALLLGLAATAAALGAVLVGPDAAISAAVGIGLVAVLFGVSALLLRHAIARDAAGGAVGLLVGGLGARVLVYLLVLEALAGTPWLHRPSLGLATGVGAVVSLTAELLWLHRSPHLFTVDPELRRPIRGHLARDPEFTL